MSQCRPYNARPVLSGVSQPLNVHCYLTPLCNLSCEHCYYQAWPASRPEKQPLNAREVGLIVSTICDRWDADFHIEGGEVFLRSDLPEIIDSIPGHYWGAVTLTTNATLPITLSVAQLRLIGNLRISAESHRDPIYRNIRGVSLQPVIRTCEKLATEGVPYEIRMTVLKENIEDLPEAVRFFAELGAARLSLYEFQPLGRGTRNQTRYRLDDQDVVRLLHVLTTIDPLALPRMTLSLPPRRSATVTRCYHAMADYYEITHLGAIPSLTINYDGALGVSPWHATADGLADQFAHLTDVDLAAEVAARLSDRTLYRLCPNCTAIQLRSRLHTTRHKE